MDKTYDTIASEIYKTFKFDEIGMPKVVDLDAIQNCSLVLKKNNARQQAWMGNAWKGDSNI